MEEIRKMIKQSQKLMAYSICRPILTTAAKRLTAGRSENNEAAQKINNDRVDVNWFDKRICNCGRNL